MIVTVKIFEEGTETLVKEYTGEVKDFKEAGMFFKEARQVWGEYDVVAEVDNTVVLSYSCTWAKELRDERLMIG